MSEDELMAAAIFCAVEEAEIIAGEPIPFLVEVLDEMYEANL